MSAYAMQQGKTVFFSSREMTNTQILQRLDAILYHLPYKEFRRGDLDTETERFYYDELEKVQTRQIEMGEFILNDDSYGGVGSLRAKIEQYEPDIAIIDGFYLMDDDQGLKSGWEKIQNISQDMKRLAKDTGIPLLATGQLNDEKQIAFFKGLERDLDLLIELEQTTDERIARVMNLNIRKQREGSKFRVRLKWDMDTMTFEEDDSGSNAMEW
jgi:replicative DNA helicase